MQEKPDGVLMTAITQHLCQRDEMIIVHPEDVVGPQPFAQLIGEKRVDPNVLKQLETALLSADLGVGTTREILDSLREKLDRNALSDSEQLKTEIKSHIARILNTADKAKRAQPALVAGSTNGHGPRVIFVVGVNGA